MPEQPRSARSRRAFRSRLLLVGATLAVTAAACGSSGPDLFDVVAARRGILAELQRVYPGLPVDAVKCPERVVLKVGRTFECRATVSTATLPVRVTIGKSRRYTAEPQGIVVTKQVAEQAVAARVTLPATTVDCGPTLVHVLSVGQTVPCAATLADGSKLNATVSVADAAGHLSVGTA